MSNQILTHIVLRKGTPLPFTASPFGGSGHDVEYLIYMPQAEYDDLQHSQHAGANALRRFAWDKLKRYAIYDVIKAKWMIQ